MESEMIDAFFKRGRVWNMKGFAMNLRNVVLVCVLVVCACAQGGAIAESDVENDAGRPHVLVTNDDGYSTEGIAALAEAIAEFADVVVVAPKENASGSSQSVRVLSSGSGGYAIDGSPADCVWVGVVLFGKDRPFDLVVSGINHGANYGTAYFYSGTVGAAFQASSQDIPAIAVSQDHQRGEFKTAAEIAARAARRVLAHPLDDGVVLSINVPGGEIKGVVAALPGDAPFGIELRPIGDEDGDTVYEAEFIEKSEPTPSHDVRAYMDGYITVTPLQLDRTHNLSLDTITGWEFITAPPR